MEARDIRQREGHTNDTIQIRSLTCSLSLSLSLSLFLSPVSGLIWRYEPDYNTFAGGTTSWIGRRRVAIIRGRSKWLRT